MLIFSTKLSVLLLDIAYCDVLSATALIVACVPFYEKLGINWLPYFVSYKTGFSLFIKYPIFVVHVCNLAVR